MLYTFPHYYSQFQCIASRCTDTCCAGWTIMIDEASLKRYGRTKGPFGSRLHNSIDWKEGSFKRYEGRCAFLDEEGLCDIYRELGPEALCRTCRTYPRHIEEFEGVREFSLCLSCIQAARMILSCEEPVRFLTREDEKEEKEEEEFDFFLYTKLTDAREWMLDLLRERKAPFSLRLSMCLALGHDLQGRLRRGQLYEADALFERYQREGSLEAFKRRLSACSLDEAERFPFIRKLFSILDEMEPLKEDWPGYKGEFLEVLFGQGQEAYEAGRQAFLQDKGSELERWSEQLMVYFIFTYFCGAVYQGTPYGKVKLAAASLLMIQNLAQALWMKEGSLDLEAMAELTHRYSREVEHSDENRALLEECLTKDPAFGLMSFLTAI